MAQGGSRSQYKRAFVCVVLACHMYAARGESSSVHCLDDAIAESDRKYIEDDQGNPISIGVFQCNWASSAVMNEMAGIWIREVLGYHSHIHNVSGATGASPVYALGGCTSFDDADDKGCGLQETRIHVSTDSWVGSYQANQEDFEKEYPELAAIDLGTMGYDGEESIFLAKKQVDAGQEDSGLALEFYRSYNTTHHDPKRYFDSLSDVDPLELALCSDTDFSNAQRMNAYARFSGDYDGVIEQPDGSYVAKCPDGRWWPAPACRDDMTKCIPTFTASPGWKLQAMMQWTAAYDFPAAIAISIKWAMFEKHVRTVRGLHYWWVPDSTFIEMLPQPVVFPRHVASEWAEGNKKTGGSGSYVSKMVSQNLQSKARLVKDFVQQIKMELGEVQAILFKHKQSGTASYFDVACDWIKVQKNRERWSKWVPDPTQCTAQFGLYNEKTKQFVQDRNDTTDIVCLACPSGHFSDKLEDGNGNGHTFVCRPCPVGTSQASGASLQCDPCPRGEYQDEEAQSSCKRCAQGFYQNEEGQMECAKCPKLTTTLGFGSLAVTECGCKDTRINIAPGNGSEFECMKCSDGLDCPFSSSKQALIDGESPLGKEYSPKILRGYYASPDDPLSVYKCEPAESCPGGQPGTCLGGLEGSPCALCPLGQFLSGDGCVECGSTPVLGVLGILFVLGFLFIFYYPNSVPKVSGLATVPKVNSMAAGLTVNALQTIALMGMMTVDWSDEMGQTSTGLQFLLLDVESLGPQCFFGAAATGRYTAICMVFPCLILWILNCWWMSRVIFSRCGRIPRLERFLAKNMRDPEKLKWTWPNTFNLIGLVLKVGFSTVSAVMLKPMTCYSHPNGKRSVLKFPNVMCGEGEQKGLLAVGLVIGSVFVLAFFSACVYAALKLPSWSKDGKIGCMNAVRFLVSDFRLNRWWFGLMPLLRGFSFSLIIAIATDAPAAQTSLVTAIIAIYGFLQAVMWPWKAPIINVCDVLLSFLMLLLVGRPNVKQVIVVPNREDWNFSRIFTLLILILIGLCISFMVLGTLTAVLVALLSRTDGKRRAFRLLNLSREPDLQDISRLLQKIGLALSNTEADMLVESLAEINHYDLKAIMKAMSIMLTEVVESRSIRGSGVSISSLNSGSRIVLGYRKTLTLGNLSDEDDDQADKNGDADCSENKEDRTSTTEPVSSPSVDGTVLNLSPVIQPCEDGRRREELASVGITLPAPTEMVQAEL